MRNFQLKVQEGPKNRYSFVKSIFRTARFFWANFHPHRVVQKVGFLQVLSQGISCSGPLGTRLGYDLVRVRGCLHDIGATFIPARVHSGPLLWLCIRLHDTNTKCHAGASHTGASSPRFLCRSETLIPARKFIPVSCKRSMTVRFISIKVSSILRHYKTRTPTNTALCKHGATFHLAPE